MSEQPTRVDLPPGGLPPAGGFWSALTGKPRTQDDLYRDPALLFNASHMAGVASTVAHWMMTRQDEDTQEMGKKLAESVGWFYAEEKGRK